MATDRTRLIVRKTIEQLRAEYSEQGTAVPVNVIETLDAFERRLDFNLDLAGVPHVTGRKPKPKAPKSE